MGSGRGGWEPEVAFPIQPPGAGVPGRGGRRGRCCQANEGQASWPTPGGTAPPPASTTARRKGWRRTLSGRGPGWPRARLGLGCSFTETPVDPRPELWLDCMVLWCPLRTGDLRLEAPVRVWGGGRLGVAGAQECFRLSRSVRGVRIRLDDGVLRGGLASHFVCSRACGLAPSKKIDGATFRIAASKEPQFWERKPMGFTAGGLGVSSRAPHGSIVPNSSRGPL